MNSEYYYDPGKDFDPLILQDDFKIKGINDNADSHDIVCASWPGVQRLKKSTPYTSKNPIGIDDKIPINLMAFVSSFSKRVFSPFA